jgi:hypothetical protein
MQGVNYMPERIREEKRENWYLPSGKFYLR